MAPDPDYLYQAADRILSVIETAFEAANVALPPRRYIAGGDVAWDCPEGQLVIHMPRIYTGLPVAADLREVRCGTTRSAAVTVWLLRCVPTLEDDADPPAAEALDDSGRELLIDALLLSDTMIRAHSRGELVDDDTQVALGDLQAVGPQGGLGGWRQDLRIQVGV